MFMVVTLCSGQVEEVGRPDLVAIVEVATKFARSDPPLVRLTP